MYLASSTADITEIEIYRFDVMRYAIVWAVVIVVTLVIAYTCNVHTHIYLRVIALDTGDKPSAETTAKKEDLSKIGSPLEEKSGVSLAVGPSSTSGRGGHNRGSHDDMPRSKVRDRAAKRGTPSSGGSRKPRRTTRSGGNLQSQEV